MTSWGEGKGDSPPPPKRGFGGRGGSWGRCWSRRLLRAALLLVAAVFGGDRGGSFWAVTFGGYSEGFGVGAGAGRDGPPTRDHAGAPLGVQGGPLRCVWRRGGGGGGAAM
jgi:hypothetical protein